MRTTLVLVTACFLAFAVGCSNESPAPRVEGPNPEAKAMRDDAYQCVKALHQLGLAAMNYREAMGKQICEPAPAKSAARYFSWRLTLLPYYDEASAELVGIPNFELPNVPDGKTPAIVQQYYDKYRSIDVAGIHMKRKMDKPGMATFRLVRFSSDPTIFAIVESADAVPWIQAAEDLFIEDSKPLPQMGGNFPAGMFALCGDQRIRFLPLGLEEDKFLKALLTGVGVPAIPTESDQALCDAIEKLDLIGMLAR